MRKFLVICTFVFYVVLASVPVRRASAFTQYAAKTVVPIGHEWLTRQAALELFDGLTMRSDDPRRRWPADAPGRATRLDLSGADTEVSRIKKVSMAATSDAMKYYGAKYDAIFAAVVGERWVDLGGFNVTTETLWNGMDCWDGVAQQPADLQYDHFMRRYDDSGSDGG
jgi:hypothetical protein